MSLRLAPASGRWLRIWNIGLLTGGLGVGQGAIFAVQTWLVAKGEFDLLAAFGTHFSFAILAIILIDAGSITVLPRHFAALREEPGGSREIWRIFWETSIFRAIVALIISAGAAFYAAENTSDDFSRWFIWLTLPALLVWASNPAGLLDGLKLSGICGITGAFAYAASAVGLALAPQESPAAAGAIIGGAFSLGHALTVGAQWAALWRCGWFPHFCSVTGGGLLRSFKDGVALMFQFVPPQAILRVQLVASTIYLGAEITALYLYAKQVVIGLAQILSFALRADFPGLVERTVGAKRLSVRDIFRAQKTTLYCTIAFTAGAALIAGIVSVVLQSKISKAAGLLVPFSSTILTASISLIMIEGLAARGAYAAIARIVTIGAVIATFLSYFLVTIFGVYAFLVGEVTSHLITIYLVYAQIRRLNGFRPASRESERTPPT